MQTINQFIEKIALDEEEILIKHFAKRPRRYRCQSTDPYDIEKSPIQINEDGSYIVDGKISI